MATLSMMGVAAIAAGVGVPADQLAVCVAIATAESGLRTDAVGHNGPTSGCPNGSRDRGLWQINDCYHPDVSDDCAFDANCNARAMYAISSGGHNWRPWSTYNNGAYQQYLTAAQVAIANLGLTQQPTGTYAPLFSAVDFARGRVAQGMNPFQVIRDTMAAIFDYVSHQL